MFRGTSFHNIDAKGRINIPTRFRAVLNHIETEPIVIAPFDHCIYGYRFDAWQEIETRILMRGQSSEAMRRFKRFFIGQSVECLCDKQGRILLPQALKEYAEISREIVLIGVLDHFEIWDKAKWDLENNVLNAQLSEDDGLRHEIDQLGL